MTTHADQTPLLGPFVGSITDSSVKIWLQMTAAGPGQITRVAITLHQESLNSDAAQLGRIDLSDESLGVGLVIFESLKPDTLYYYRLWQDEAHTVPLDLHGLALEDLHFRTLPENGYEQQLDFLLMSCHNPEKAKGDGFDGFAVWRQIPQIMEENKNVRFAIMAGDQVYGDEVEVAVLAERDLRERQKLYLSMYRKFWDNKYYRKVLCSLPAILIWDDHDITDGWGSREDSFIDDKSSSFKPEWKALFETARVVFKLMQALRNPEPLSKDFKLGFDTCFKVGRAGFAIADLRSNRNLREQRIWLPEQLQGIKDWVEAHKTEIDTLFFVSSVVFSHGAPRIERGILKYWFYVLDLINWIGRFRRLKNVGQMFSEGVGDIRDDINDSWGSDVNRKEADRVLDFLFDLQNPPGEEKAINVVILTGDIHTSGYSTIYSRAEKHSKRAVIPHVVATPVAYQPFSWFGEAIFRHLTRVVALGEKGIYSAQVSHHFCYRNVVVVSLRNYAADESHLKVKYYLEGFPEPQVMFFDLNHDSHREAISWPDLKVEQPLP